VGDKHDAGSVGADRHGDRVRSGPEGPQQTALEAGEIPLEEAPSDNGKPDPALDTGPRSDPDPPADVKAPADLPIPTGYEAVTVPKEYVSELKSCYREALKALEDIRYGHTAPAARAREALNKIRLMAET